MPEAYHIQGGEDWSSGENEDSAKKDNALTEQLLEDLRLSQIELDKESQLEDNTMGRRRDNSDDMLADLAARRANVLPRPANMVSSLRYSCVSCSPPDCSEASVCHNAMSCYTAHVRDVHGREMKSRGCTADAQQALLHCSTKQYDGKAVHAARGQSAQYAIHCCAGSMCNNRTQFPRLPDVPQLETTVVEATNEQTAHVVRLVMAVVCPVAVLGILVTLILLFMRQVIVSVLFSILLKNSVLF